MTTDECKRIIGQNYKEIYRFVLYLADNSALAEDLTQEVFLAAWTNADKFKHQSSVKTWLYRIAYNKFIDFQRKSNRQNSLLRKYEENCDKDARQIDPLKKVLDDDDSRCLYEALHKLDEPDYTVILMHYIQGLSSHEIAEILARPNGTIKWQINQAMNKLKDLLAE